MPETGRDRIRGLSTASGLPAPGRARVKEVRQNPGPRPAFFCGTPARSVPRGRVRLARAVPRGFRSPRQSGRTRATRRSEYQAPRNHIADNQCPLIGCLPNRGDRCPNEGFVWNQKVEQDVRVDSGNHRPRISSMNLSTDEYPSAENPCPHRPFHFRIAELLRAFFSTMTPCSKLNSTSVFARNPKRSRIAFGMVT